jgi:hypothetical protein
MWHIMIALVYQALDGGPPLVKLQHPITICVRILQQRI